MWQFNPIPLAQFLASDTPEAAAALAAISQGIGSNGGGGGADGLSAYQLWLQQGNSGTVAQFLASLVGSPGADGQDGAPGQDGADGLSAYQLWLQQGNSGTVVQFLASLVGETGATGATGAKGDKGDKGDPGDSGGFSAATQTLLGRTSFGYSFIQKAELDHALFRLTDTGLRAKLDRLVCMRMGNATDSLLDWLSDTSLSLVADSGVTPTWVKGQGYRSSDSGAGGGYLNTGWSPSSGVNYQQNDCCAGVMLSAHASGGNYRVMFGAFDGTSSLRIIQVQGQDFWFGSVNSAQDSNSADIPDMTGMITIRRTNATQEQILRNGTVLTTYSRNSTGRPSRPVYVLTFNENGVPGGPNTRLNVPASVWFAGAGLTNAELVTLKSIFDRLFTVL